MQAVGAGLDVRVHAEVERLELEQPHVRRLPSKEGARLLVPLPELPPLEGQLGRLRAQLTASI